MEDIDLENDQHHSRPYNTPPRVVVDPDPDPAATEETHSNIDHRNTILAFKKGCGRFRISTHMLTFGVQALLSFIVVIYFLVCLATGVLPESAQQAALSLITFVLGVWLPNPAQMAGSLEKGGSSSSKGFLKRK
jgi:hypothetical protein